MKVTCPPGFRTDMPPCASEPFWFYGENIRFKEGVPETIGLFAKLLNTTSGLQVQIALGGGTAEFYADKSVIIVGHGNTLTTVNYETGATADYTITPAESEGRWWFAPIEDTIIAARGSLNATVWAIDRATMGITALPNAPTGAIAGGVLGGILILAGTLSIGGVENKLIVRWSARRSDPSSSGTPSGPFGFEDWTVSDLNSAGEVPLEEGSTIVGGGVTELGFIVWTDTHTVLLTPRTDTYVFTDTKVSSRGLLANRAWIEADGRVWWYDQTMTLNVLDGGAAQQVPCTMRKVSVEMIDASNLDRCYMSTNLENSELILHYPDQSGDMRELVYNYGEDAWYPWSIDRLAFTDAHGERPMIGIDSDGYLWNHNLRETTPEATFWPSNDIWMEPGDPLPGGAPSAPGPTISATPAPEPYSFFLMTNRMSGENAALDSLRSRTVVIPFNDAVAPVTGEDGDPLIAAVQSYGTTDLDETPTVDRQELSAGEQLARLRAGGKFIQFIVAGIDVTTQFRFSAIDVEADGAGKR